MNKSRIISAFPGVGKTYFCSITNKEVIDSDSMNYSYSKAWPDNYVREIKRLRACEEKYDYVLVSTHWLLRQALVKEKIEFTLVYPYSVLKNEYLRRYRARGSEEVFIDFMDAHWDSYIEEMLFQYNCQHIILGPGEYLSDKLEI